jgi:SHS2 domain-containing protein
VDYRSFEHTADTGIEAWGKDLAQLFSNAGKALFDVAVELNTVKPKEAVEIELEAEDATLLLHRWLSELLYYFTAKGMVFGKFEFTSISETALKAKAWGEKFEDERHHVKTDIKAVTYHQLEVRPGWYARAILDL